MSAGLRHSRHGAGDLRGRGCAEVRLGARRSRPVGRRIGGSLWRSADVTSGIRSIPGSDRRALKSGIGTVAACTLARHRPQRPATDGVPGTAPHGRRLAVREIARRLARALSTVSRELRRNLRPHDRGSFDGDSSPARAPGRGAAATKAAVESPARAAADRAGRARGRVERGVGRRAAAGSSSRAADCDLSHATIHWALHHGGRATWTGHRSRGRPAGRSASARAAPRRVRHGPSLRLGCSVSAASRSSAVPRSGTGRATSPSAGSAARRSTPCPTNGRLSAAGCPCRTDTATLPRPPSAYPGWSPAAPALDRVRRSPTRRPHHRGRCAGLHRRGPLE